MKAASIASAEVCRHTKFIYDSSPLNDMSESEFVAESKVSGNQANIPAPIRRALGIEDGDRLRWRYRDDVLAVEVIDRRERTFAGFEGYSGGPGGDVVADHDAFGLGNGASADDEG